MARIGKASQHRVDRERTASHASARYLKPSTPHGARLASLVVYVGVAVDSRGGNAPTAATFGDSALGVSTLTSALASALGGSSFSGRSGCRFAIASSTVRFAFSIRLAAATSAKARSNLRIR